MSVMENVTEPPPVAERPAVTERPAARISGLLAVLAMAVMLALSVIILFVLPEGLAWVAAIPVILFFLALATLTIVSPNEARVIEFFGRYIGIVRFSGLSSVVPFASRRRVSLRVRNSETGILKVNDASGNPIEIAAIIVWRVEDPAKAVYGVEDYVDFVAIQSQSALRHIAMRYPYDAPEGVTLLGATGEIAAELAVEVADRVGLAGVGIVEVRISHLAYAPEIAQAMLRRQQAAAVVAARAKIVEGAVTMVDTALRELTAHGVVELDEERKASMVSNLMVVLCSDQPASPIVNAGTLYS